MNYEQYLYDTIYSTVVDYAKFSNGSYDLRFNSLPDEVQSEISRLSIESNDRDIGECLHGNDFSVNNNLTLSLLRLLRKDDIKSKQDFATVARDNVIKYFSESIQKTIDQCCEEYTMDMMLNNGWNKKIHKDNGETFWSKCA